MLIDNGSHTLKIGLAGEPARVLPNYALLINDSNPPLYGSYLKGVPIIIEAYKTFICKGGEICERELEDLVWRDALLQLYNDRNCMLSSSLHSLSPTCSDLDLITTTSPDAHPAEKRQLLEYCFETMQFASIVAQSPQTYLTKHPVISGTTSGIILDVGYTGTSATAFLYTNPLLYSHTFMDCGGKLLDNVFTNLLQETIDPMFLAGIRKRCLLIESLRDCFFAAEENSQIGIVFCNEKNDYTVRSTLDTSSNNNKDRYNLGIRNTESIMRSLLEQITVNFPSIVTGCIQSLPTELHPLSKGNVFLCGGLANIRPLVEIVKDTLLASSIVDSLTTLPNPHISIYDGMQAYADTTEYLRSRITRQLYEEYGSIGLEHN